MTWSVFLTGLFLVPVKQIRTPSAHGRADGFVFIGFPPPFYKMATMDDEKIIRY